MLYKTCLDFDLYKTVICGRIKNISKHEKYMFIRALKSKLQDVASKYLVVTVVGPRQSGKTTLVKDTFVHKPYINLEAPDVRELIKSDPRGFLSRFPDGAIFDEIQRVPELLSYIQVIVDEKKIKGMFILTGSHQLELHQAITQSLAGRTSILTLLPLSIQEITSFEIKPSVDDLILKGGYPQVYQEKLEPYELYRNYFQTYVERDVRSLTHIKDLAQFEKFIRILAGRIGREVNLEEIGGEIGSTAYTIKGWISILEASFIIFRLQPYYENLGKRLVKSPKIYFLDVGFASYLLGIENANQLSRDPLRGHLFENLIVLELLKYRYNMGKDPQLYFYRDVRQNEVDVIFKQGNLLTPIEIKSSSTFNSDFLKNLKFFQELAKEKSTEGYLIYSGDNLQKIHNMEILNYLNATKCLGI